MDDVEQALSGLQEESPPPEIVLAAVRTFRYRAIAVVASIVAAVFVLGVAGRFLGPENLGAEVASLRGATTVPILAEAEYDGIRVTMTELVWREDTGHVRFVAVDNGSHAEVDIEAIALTSSTGRKHDLGPNSIVSVSNFETPQGDRIDRRTDAGWVKFIDPDHDPYGPLSMELQLVEVPLEVVLEGGVVTGPYPTLTIDHEGTELR